MSVILQKALYLPPAKKIIKNQAMQSTTGKINVQTENIFPIIKKFLYSDHEIFLRELVSNAVDATQKLKTLTSIGENKNEIGDTTITITIDKEDKTIVIADKGVGMTSEEVEKYINQIAFSGAEEFVNKYKAESVGNPLIGHFGLGFYSAFMVSDKVEILTRSYKSSTACHWECDGSPDYTLTESEKPEPGTTITLHISDDSAEFLSNHRISELLSKYCKFLPIAISFEGKVINNTSPAWTKKPADLLEEDYKNFYHELYPVGDDPLFNIHLNVDYPFNLTGILYFPKLKKNFEIQKNKIQLYCNQVFVTDAVEGIVPEFLTLLHGVLDSPDIPLNVSRSYLQSDGNVKKISSHITKKVADKLESLFLENRSDFESKWDDIGMFIKYGVLSDDKFNEKAKNFCLLKNTDQKYFTFEEYKQLISLNQEDKNKKIVYLYTNNPVEQHSFIESAKNRGYDVLLMDGALDSHFVNHLEQKLENTLFVRVDAETVDKLIVKEELITSGLDEEQKKNLQPIMEAQVNTGQFKIVFENMRSDDMPVVITKPEFMRRMKDMAASGGGYDFMGSMPDQYQMVVNTNHPLFVKILQETDVFKKAELAKQATDLAMLAQNLLKGEALTGFIQKNIEMIS